MKHTPGPWSYSRTHSLSRNYWYVVTDAKGYGPIIEVGGQDKDGQIAEAKHLITDPQEIEANARLIAASPELLGACRGALAALTQNKTYPADIDAAKMFLSKAIAKAEGRKP